MSAAAAAAVLLGAARHAQACGEKLTFDELVARVGTLARALIQAGERDEDAYLAEVSALLGRVTEVPRVKLGAPFKGVISTGLNHRGSGIVVVQWRMEPNTAYPAHDHPNYNGLTLGLEGTCRIRNFQPMGAVPPRDSRQSFQLIETRSAALRPGTVASLMTTRRDNMHDLSAGPEGARGIDVMTLLDKHIGFSFVELGKVVRLDDRRPVRTARWGERIKG